MTNGEKIKQVLKTDKGANEMKEECKYLFDCFPLNNVLNLLDEEAERVCKCLSDNKLDDSEKLFNVGKILGRTKTEIFSVLDAEREKSAHALDKNESEYNNISWAVKQVLKEIGKSGKTIKTADVIDIINKYKEKVM